MNPVGLRLQLTPDVLAKLVEAVSTKFRNFVRIKDTKNAGQVYEVNLSILDSYHTGTIDMVTPVNQVTVTREMVGELFDLLGIFLRDEKQTLTVAQAGTELLFVAEKLLVIERTAAGVITDGSEARYFNEIFKLASVAIGKVNLLLRAAGVQ